ncbi:MAG: phosphatase PAP2 family protein [Verrucomicrobiae bacterium]|nr:phosphatase PAP2 family protein [Verrucomicrobiae bacterium]
MVPSRPIPQTERSRPDSDPAERPSDERNVRGRWILGLLLGCAPVAVALWFVLGLAARARLWGAHGQDPWSTLAGEISSAGRLEWIVAWLLPLFAGALVRRRPQSSRLFLAMILATVFAGLVAMALRGVIGRTRPNANAPQGWYGPYHQGRWLIGRTEFNGFPSGHAATAAGVMGVLIFAGTRGRWLAQAFPIAICWSRVYLLRHHVSDVLVGSLLGWAFAWWVWVRVMPRIPRWWTNDGEAIAALPDSAAKELGNAMPSSPA